VCVENGNLLIYSSENECLKIINFNGFWILYDVYFEYPNDKIYYGLVDWNYDNDYNYDAVNILIEVSEYKYIFIGQEILFYNFEYKLLI